MKISAAAEHPVANIGLIIPVSANSADILPLELLTMTAELTRKERFLKYQTIVSFIFVAAYVCLLCMPEVWSQKKQSERELDGLVGPVQVVREYRTFSKQRPKPAEVQQILKTRPYKTLTYDRGGDLLEEDNLWGLRYTYSFSPIGFRVKIANGDKSPGSGDSIPPYVAERSTDNYDPSGYKIETVVYLKNEAIPWFRRTYEYNDRGRMQRLLYYGRDATSNLKLSYVVTYTYDVKGNQREACWRDPAGALMDRLSYTNYKFDRMGNWVERTEARYQLFSKNQPKEQWGTIYRVITYY